MNLQLPEGKAFIMSFLMFVKDKHGALSAKEQPQMGNVAHFQNITQIGNMTSQSHENVSQLGNIYHGQLEGDRKCQQNENGNNLPMWLCK